MFQLVCWNIAAVKLGKFSVTNCASPMYYIFARGKRNTRFMLISALHQESNNMVVPAMQLASKIPDMSVQLWSSALLRGKLGKGLVLKISGKEPVATNWWFTMGMCANSSAH